MRREQGSYAGLLLTGSVRQEHGAVEGASSQKKQLAWIAARFVGCAWGYSKFCMDVSWVQERWATSAWGCLLWCVLAWGKEKWACMDGPTWKRRSPEAADGSSAGSVCKHMGGSRRARERKALQVGLDLAAVLGLIWAQNWACKNVELDPNRA